MTNKIPEWAMAEARRCCPATDTADNEAAIRVIARALVATAARVERETIKSCYDLAPSFRKFGPRGTVKGDQITHNGAIADYGLAISALPLKYQEHGND